MYQAFHIWEGKQEGERVAHLGNRLKWQSYFVFGALSLRNARDLSRFNKVINGPGPTSQQTMSHFYPWKVLRVCLRNKAVRVLAKVQKNEVG